MSAEGQDPLNDELLDDFFAESADLLAAIRDGLLLVEQQGDSPANQQATSEAVFRHVHTLKGNAAIVGLQPVERLAHAMEELLRGRRSLTLPQVDALMIAAKAVEQLVAARRERRALPGIDRELAAIARVAPAGKERSTPGGGAVAGPLWHATFAPSKELDARGINVAAIRERLKHFGTVVRGTPVIQPDKTITFNFVVAAKDGLGTPESWAGDGVTIAPESPVPAAAPTPSEPVVAPEAGAFDSLAPSHLVRIDMGRLDELMRLTGELVIQRSRLEDRIQQRADHAVLRETSVALGRTLRQLRGALTRVRLVPIAEIFTRMPHVVRDLLRDSQQRVRVELEGRQTEIDKYLVERLKEPLLHLVRNALSHGIEPEDERRAAGKPPEACLRLEASNVADLVEIRVRDDGRGVDPARIAKRARSLGLTVPAVLDDDALLKLICTPGFSTRESADRAAGRGMGMAVVASTLRELGGSFSLRSTPRQGTEFILRLPLTLSIADAIIVSSGGQLYAVPQASVHEVRQFAVSSVRTIKRAEVVPYRNGLLPIVRLEKVFGRPDSAKRTEFTVLVIESDRGLGGLVVERVRTQREIVVRPVSDPLVRVHGVCGATELGDGRPILILDAVGLTGAVTRPVTAVEASPVREPALPA